MKLVTHIVQQEAQLAIVHNNRLYNIKKINNTLPYTMKGLLNDWENQIGIFKKIDQEIKEGKYQSDAMFENANIIAPVNEPTSCRDGYAFRQHVASARRNRKVDLFQPFDALEPF